MNDKKAVFIFATMCLFILLGQNQSLSADGTTTSSSNLNSEKMMNDSLNSAPPKEYLVSLHDYVPSILRKSAMNIEGKQADVALKQLSKINPIEKSCQAEFHYIKALCLQSKKKFNESATTFEQAENLSIDPVLQSKARLGAKRATEKLQLSKDQFLFLRMPTKYPAILEEQFR